MRKTMTAVLLLCSLSIVHPGTGIAATAAKPKKDITGFRTLTWGDTVEKLGAGAKKPAESYQGYERRDENLIVYGSKAESISYFFNDETKGLEKVTIDFPHAAKQCERLKNSIQKEYGAASSNTDMGNNEKWFFWIRESGSIHLSCNWEGLESVDKVEIKEDDAHANKRVVKQRKSRMAELNEYIAFCAKMSSSGSCEGTERLLAELPSQPAGPGDKREYFDACTGERSGIFIVRREGSDVELGEADVDIGGAAYTEYAGRVQDGTMSGTVTLLIETMDGNIEKGTETWSWRAVQKKGFPSSADCANVR